MERLSSHLRRALPLLVLLLCILQPVMDVASYFLIRAQASTAPMQLLRTLVLAAMTLCGLVISRRKTRYWVVLGVLGGYTLLHILACIQAGYQHPLSDLGNQLRIFLMPLTCLAFLTFLEESDGTEQAMVRGMVWAFGIILGVMLVSTLTGTDPHTYDSGFGISGWFFGGNCQSAILSMLVPVALYAGLQKGTLPFAVAAVLGFGALYLLGPRLAYAALMATGFCFFVGLLLINRKAYWPAACIVLVCALGFAALYPLSPMRAEQTKHANAVAQRQERIDTIYAQVLETQGQQAAYDAVYREYAEALMDRFGAQTIEEAYGYTLRYDKIAPYRDQKLLYGRLLMAESPAASRWFGLELSRFYHGDAIFDVENDFGGIYYLCGLAGLALMLLYFGIFCGKLGISLLLRFRTTFTPAILALSVSFCCGLVHAYFTSGVLRRNNASVYLGILMAWGFHLLRNTAKERSRTE